MQRNKASSVRGWPPVNILCRTSQACLSAETGWPNVPSPIWVFRLGILTVIFNAIYLVSNMSILMLLHLFDAYGRILGPVVEAKMRDALYRSILLKKGYQSEKRSREI